MKAHRERLAGPAGQPVLAAQIIAIGRQVKLARIAQPEARLVAVMRRGDPLMSVLLGTLAMHRVRGMAKRAVGLDLDRVGVADDQHRMSGAGTRDLVPGRLWAAIAAAIDDDPIASLAQLE